MKRSVAAALVFVAGLGSLRAQKVSVSLEGGLLVPTGDYGTADNIGFLAGLAISFPAGPIAIRATGDYGQTSHKGIDGTSQITGGIADILYSFPGASVKPYLFGGVGYYHVGVQVAGFSGGESNVAFNLGAGLNLGKGYVEARYTSISTSGSATTFFPILVGVTF